MSTCHSFKKLKRKLDFFFKMQEDLSSLRTLGTGDEGDTCVEKSTMGRDQAAETRMLYEVLGSHEMHCGLNTTHEDEALNDKN